MLCGPKFSYDNVVLPLLRNLRQGPVERRYPHSVPTLISSEPKLSRFVRFDAAHPKNKAHLTGEADRGRHPGTTRNATSIMDVFAYSIA